MKKVFAVICTILIVVFLAGCSQEASSPKPEEPNNQADQADVSPMVETIAGVEVVLDDYDFVAVKDYAGKYLDKLEKKEINIGGGSSTYTVAIFGKAQDLAFATGEYQTSGGDIQKIADQVSNTLLTFTNAPGGEPNIYCGLWINDSKHKIQLAPNDEIAKNYALIAVKDGNEIELGTETQPGNNATDDGRIEVRTIAGGKDFELLIEKDKSKEVVKGVPVYYLSMKYSNGEKKLLAQSVDRGDYWTNSIATIESPAMSNDGTKVYYSTDNTFTRSSGYGANNYRTRVVNLKTFEDSYFEEGALVEILNSSNGSYANHVVLELNSLDNAGKPTMVYQVVTPTGGQLVVLESRGNWQSQIDAKLNGSNDSQQITPPKTESVHLLIDDMPHWTDKSSLVESIHGYELEYNRYYSVIIPNYPVENGEYPFARRIQFDNPAYSSVDNDYFFAVVGTIHDVRLQTQADMNSPVKLYKVADTIEDAHVFVRTSFPTDMSYDKIHYRDFNGTNYTVTFTDMGEEDKVQAIKLPY